MIHGTSYFVSKEAAIRYYKSQGLDADDVQNLLNEGSIHIGVTHIKADERLILLDSGKRYGIEETESIAIETKERHSKGEHMTAKDISEVIETLEITAKGADTKARTFWNHKTAQFEVGELETNARIAGYRDGLLYAIDVLKYGANK